jgi:hypothetical protein
MRGCRIFRNDTCLRSATSGRRSAHQKASSRANGTKFGRPRKVYDPEHIATAKRMKADGHTARTSRSTSDKQAALNRHLGQDCLAC